MTRTIVITSGKGGVGKTNLAVNSGLELASRHFKTCLLDADLGLANANILLGIHPERNLDDFLFADTPLKEIIVKTEYGLDLIPGSSGIEKTANLPPHIITRLIKELSELTGYDFFLIDTSSGISKGVISFCLAASETIVVLTPESTSMTDAYALLKVLAVNRYKGKVRILVNRCSTVPLAQKTYLRFKGVAEKHLDISISPAGLILDDPQVEQAVIQQQSVLKLFPQGLSSQCIRSVVSNLIKDEGDESSQDDFGTFWSRYFKVLQSDLNLPGQSVAAREIAQRTVSKEPSSFELVESKEVEIRTEKSPPPLVKENPIPITGVGVVSDLTVLPTPIPLLSTILQLNSRGSVTSLDLEGVISADTALLTKIIALYGASYPYESERRLSVKKIMNELGAESVNHLLCTTALQRALAEPPSPKESELLDDFWGHCYKCGLMAKGLAEVVGYLFVEEIFISGMLHDIGRLAMQAHNPEIYSTISHGPSAEGRELEIETEYFGTTHRELSTEIIKELPVNSLIITAAQLSTEVEPNIDAALDLTKIIYFAHQLCADGPDQSNTVRSISTCFKLPVSAVYRCIESAEKTFVSDGERYQMLSGRRNQGDRGKEDYAQLKDLAMEHLLIQNNLPSRHYVNKMSEIVRCIHQGMSHVFGVREVICLIPETESRRLKACGYRGCFGHGYLGNIEFSLDSPRSVVVDSFLQQKILFTPTDKLKTLADKQLLGVFQSEFLMCLPLVAKGEVKGLVVGGSSLEKSEGLNNNKKRLKQFCSQSASIVSVLSVANL